MSKTTIKFKGFWIVLWIILLIYNIISMATVAKDQATLDKKIDDLNVRIEVMKEKCP